MLLKCLEPASRHCQARWVPSFPTVPCLALPRLALPCRASSHQHCLASPRGLTTRATLILLPALVTRERGGDLQRRQGVGVFVGDKERGDMESREIKV
ncbi:hypothetical protein E2C01_028614 [Portunus trituberculatus]|uniref:Uncharacterized protein n=1 Tax=Portunus trituberculatus TaxID=210409 RepID=A0A5B7EPH8_PORTR|nr:hypothetical protein [Portunus trituberculatus]